MTATLLPNGKQQFLDDNGDPLVGGKVYFYIPATTTPKNTYQDEDQTILNTNPVILDARGEAIIYGTGRYRELLTDALDNTIYDVLTQDVLSLFPPQDVFWGGTTAGAANAFTLAPSPALTTLITGQVFEGIADRSNTGVATLQINSIAPLEIKVNSYAGPIALVGNEIRSGNRIRFMYDGTQAIMLNPAVGITPTVGDSSTQLATTAFLANLGIKFSGSQGYAANVTLTATDLGKVIRPSGGTPFTITLPIASTGDIGKVLVFASFTAGGAVTTIARQGSDIITIGSSAVTSFMLRAGDTAFLVCYAAGEWSVISGSAELGYSGEFASLLSANGYQRLPGGVILQWGAVALPDNTPATVTLPITYTSQIFAQYASVDFAGAAGGGEFNTAGARNIGVLNQISVDHNSGPSVSVSATCYWWAVGI